MIKFDRKNTIQLYNIVGDRTWTKFGVWLRSKYSSTTTQKERKINTLQTKQNAMIMRDHSFSGCKIGIINPFSPFFFFFYI